jgi:hypothetical protein
MNKHGVSHMGMFSVSTVTDSTLQIADENEQNDTDPQNNVSP